MPSCWPCTRHDGEADSLRPLQTVAFFLARLTVFRIKEAPRFLAAAGRPEEAAEALRYIAAFNGVPTGRLEKELDTYLLAAARASQSQDEDGEVDEEDHSPTPPAPSRPALQQDVVTSYASTASTSPEERPRFPFATPSREDRQSFMDGLRQAADAPTLPLRLPSSATTPDDVEDQVGSAIRRPPAPRRVGSRSPLRATAPVSRMPSIGQLRKKTIASLAEGKGKLLEIFRPEWRRTTILIWVIWSCLSMAYTSAFPSAAVLRSPPPLLKYLPGPASVQRILADNSRGTDRAQPRWLWRRAERGPPGIPDLHGCRRAWLPRSSRSIAKIEAEPLNS